MHHRDLVSQSLWTPAAIESVIARGALADWRELFSVAKQDRRVSDNILKVTSRIEPEGHAILARALTFELRPGLAAKNLQW